MHFLHRDPFQSPNAVRPTQREKLFQLGFFPGGNGDDQLAASDVGHIVRGGELVGQTIPFDTMESLERVGRIVNARVDHTAVTGARRHADARQLFEDENVICVF